MQPVEKKEEVDEGKEGQDDTKQRMKEEVKKVLVKDGKFESNDKEEYLLLVIEESPGRDAGSYYLPLSIVTIKIRGFIHSPPSEDEEDSEQDVQDWLSFLKLISKYEFQCGKLKTPKLIVEFLYCINGK